MRAGLAPLLRPTGLAPGHRAVVMMASTSPPPLSAGLLATDGAVCALYSLFSSIFGLFSSGEYLSPTLAVTAQDLVDVVVAFDSASALALGWCLASAVTGCICSQDWFSLPADQHQGSALGVKGLLTNWLVGFPLGEVLKALALYGIAAGGWAAPSQLPSTSALDVATTLVFDGVGILVALTLWRRWLLGWLGYG